MTMNRYKKLNTLIDDDHSAYILQRFTGTQKVIGIMVFRKPFVVDLN
jgi:hypothetical protein